MQVVRKMNGGTYHWDLGISFNLFGGETDGGDTLPRELGGVLERGKADIPCGLDEW
jgi:hypothetical protein